MMFGLVTNGFINARLPAGKRLSARIVERPGCWMDAEGLAALTEELKSVARTVLDKKDLAYGVFDAQGDAISRSLITVLYDKHSGAPVAFNVLPVLEIAWRGGIREILHLGLVMVDPNAQGKGISSTLYGFSCVLYFMRNQLRPMWVSSVTQVPAVFGLVAEIYSEVFPGQGETPSFEHVLMARRIMETRRDAFGVGPDAAFDEQQFIIANAYTGGSDSLKKTFDESPKHRQDRYNARCADLLDYGRGDDFLQIGKLDLAAVQRYLRRVAPPGSAAGLLATSAMIALHRLVLPLYHWFDHRRQWGDLSPRKLA